MDKLQTLIQHYRPLVRERADEMHAAGSRLSHHTVWFPLVDGYEPKEGEPHISRATHKKAALTVFNEWCEENQVKPASMGGEVMHNLLLLVRGGAAFFGIVSVGFSVLQLFKGRYREFFVFLGIGIFLWLLALGLVLVHAAFRDKVFRDSGPDTSEQDVKDKLSKFY